MATKNIRRVAVIGAGTMGRGIAAQVANAHREVDLLDIVPPDLEGDELDDAEARNQLALEAIEAVAGGRRPALTDERLADLITPGNIEDHLDRIAEADWIVEAVPEEMEIKRETFDKIAEHAAADAIIASNTSGLSIAGILEGRSDDFCERFVVTHFFNPVQVMKLLELVPAEQTDPEVMETVVQFGRDVLGKGIVFGKDTTNFVANRIGVHDQMVVLHERERFEMPFEDVDQILREPMGRPSSAMFKLLDIIGLDTVVHAAHNCHGNLVDDENRDLYQVPDWLHEMVEEGWLGRKAGQGFYQKTDRGIEALNLETWEYEPRDFSEFESLKQASGTAAERIKSIVVEGDDEAAEFARAVTLKSVAYAARRLGEIADDIVNIDRAMRWGFNWELGPFEQWDAIGLQWGLERMKEAEIAVPDWAEAMVEQGVEGFYRRDGAQRLYWDPFGESWEQVPEDPKRIDVSTLREKNKRRAGSPRSIESNESATLHDMGDGVLLAEFHSKMNAVDDGIIELLYEAIDRAEEEGWRGLVIGNDGSHFSAGANLEKLLERAEDGRWEKIREHSKWFQDLNQRLRYSTKPVVTAPHGYTLGGGAEIAMAGDAIVAHAGVTMGLVETGVGIIPGAGGNLQLLRKVLGPHAEERSVDPMPLIEQVFDQIRKGRMAKSGDLARRAGFLDAADSVMLNADHLLHAAKQRVISLADGGYRPPLPTKFRLPGPDGVAVLDAKMHNWREAEAITEHDRVIWRKVAQVLCGGETSPRRTVSEERLLELEREAFVSLCGEEKSRERMRHMLENGRRLKN